MRRWAVTLALAYGGVAHAWVLSFEDDFSCSDTSSFAREGASLQGWSAMWSDDPWSTLGVDGVQPATGSVGGGFGWPPDDYENFLLTGHPLWEDERIEAVAHSTDDDAFGLVARVQGPASYYACWTTNDALPGCSGSVNRPGTWLVRVDANQACVDDYVVAGAAAGFPTATDVRMRLTALGADIQCEVDLDGDGVFGGPADVVLAYSDPSALKAGGVGLASFGSSGLSFDDVRIENADPDLDADGLPNAVEDLLGTYRVLADSDQDGIPDRVEVGMQTYPYDSDGDSVIDALELDSDNDGISDWIEGGLALPPANTDCALAFGKDARPDYRDVDSDGDFFLDGTDLCRLVPNSFSDADGDGLAPECDPDDLNRDTDGDGLEDGAEVNEYGTDPTQADTDGAGVDDGTEVFLDGTDPRDPTDDILIDTDGDGLPDPVEDDLGTDPFAWDTDLDGLGDGDEVGVHGTDPLVADTDGDGVWDGDELAGGTSPTNPDTDGDGLRDGQEAGIGSDPTRSDTDGDGVDDGTEVITHGSDPTRADSDGDGLDDGFEAMVSEIHGGDRDGDGLSDLVDDDDDGDLVPTSWEDLDGDGDWLEHDTDGDEVPNWLDADDDGDGIPTADEDWDGDGDPTNDDLDRDGVPSYLQANELDLGADSDNDGLPDVIELEIGSDPDRADSDGDGLADGAEVGVASAPTDTDGDGVPDLLDPDDDGDGVPTAEELDQGTFPRDIDGDGLPDHLDPDSDNDMAWDGADPEPLDPGHGDTPGVPSAKEPGFGLGCVHTPGMGFGGGFLALLALRRRAAPRGTG